MIESNEGARSVDLSIIMCTRNRGDRLRPFLDAVESIRSDKVWELVLVDNNSADETAALLQAFAEASPVRALYHLETRAGLGAARKSGTDVASGRIIAFTDDDCYPAPDFVDRVLEAFEGAPNLGCVGGRIELHDPADLPITIDEREERVEISARTFLPAGELQGANLSFPKPVLDQIGGFDPELGAGTDFPCEDVDVVARVLWAGFEARYDPGPVVSHHHGRRQADLDGILKSYAKGRGAYFAKFILRPETRRAYMAGWRGKARSIQNRRQFAMLRLELGYAWRYAWRKTVGGLPLIGALLVLQLGTGALALVRTKVRSKLA
ncbi:MAG: glycosyltransferase family 2 protein [Erythrobacter sp.]|nr:glycosyltransferase family 2 protein [Erythrobacter sp.]